MQDFRMETFLTASKLLSYTDTAKELHITQPAVSQHIRFLEEHYNAKLFRYEGKKFCLTEAGVLLRKAATTMKHDEITLLETLKASPRKKLVFGATRTIGDYFIPDTLIQYLTNEQNTDICMLVDNTETLLHKIDSGELDFALVEGYFRTSEYDYKVFSEQNFIAVCGVDDLLNGQNPTIDSLFESCIIVREPGSGTREILERYLNERNCSIANFQRVIEVGSIRAIKSLVSANCTGEGAPETHQIYFNESIYLAFTFLPSEKQNPNLFASSGLAMLPRGGLTESSECPIVFDRDTCRSLRIGM